MLRNLYCKNANNAISLRIDAGAIMKITIVLLLFFNVQASANGHVPPIEIKGQVVDKQGNPLEGVSVSITGTLKGTTTNSDGRFALNIPEGLNNIVLEVSNIGFTSKTVTVGNQTEIKITLEEAKAGLDQVVVVGYGRQSKRNITSSIGSVSSKDIGDYPVQQIGQALQGKITNVQIVQQSGAPGSSMMIRIRGTRTVNNSEPLYVIDGNLGADPNDLDPNSIASIEVLKSASAAAIYGSQGANGVVMITTKKGISGAPSLQIDYSKGFQQVHRTMPVMNAKQFATIYNQALTNGGRSPLFADVESLGEGTNWQNEMFRTAPIQNVGFSVSGGGKQGTYYISADYFTQKGIVINTDYSRLNFRLNSEYKINPAITFGENLSLSYAVRNDIPEFGGRDPVANSWHMDPTTPVKNPDGTWGFPKFSDTKNPVAEATFYNNTIKRPALNASAYFDIKPLNNLVYRSQINVNLGFSNGYQFTPTFDIYPLQRNLTNSVGRVDAQWTNWDWQNTITYKIVEGSHTLEILGGTTILSNHS
ncbi:MAG TPA: SusC/RagA family TonB-linked outer membrane protein, partial [Flavitalea sp.]|nr:SusC/RagA family TonB-linked outer membrane protein [Flavitalea sp.]